MYELIQVLQEIGVIVDLKNCFLACGFEFVLNFIGLSAVHQILLDIFKYEHCIWYYINDKFYLTAVITGLPSYLLYIDLT